MRAVLAAVIVAAFAAPALAQNDTTPIRILVGVQPGATTDLVARQLAEKMRTTLGETIVVENRAGAGQQIAMGEVKKAPPDGRTMILAASAAFSILPHIYGDRLPYDPVKDFTPISRIVIFQVGFAAGLKTGAANVADFVSWVKAHPDEGSYASPGAGTSSHFAGLMFAKLAGINLTHVPYKGTAPALTDLMGGHIAMVSTAFSDLPELHRAGKIKIFATTGFKRSPAAPDVATLREQGIDIAFDVAFDLYTSANVPPAVVAKLNAAAVQAALAPDSRQRFESIGLQTAGSTPQELAAKQAEELALWAEPVKASGFTGE